jgi:hypothetical protein
MQKDSEIKKKEERKIGGEVGTFRMAVWRTQVLSPAKQSLNWRKLF